MNGIVVEIVIILVLILVNGLLSMSEIAVVSSRKIRLQQRAVEGDRGAQAALDLSESPGRFLSTVQIGITLVGILAGAFGGATIAESLAPVFADIPSIARYADALSVGIVVVLITYLTLVLGELAPKQIALANTERVAATVAPIMKTLAKATSPFVSFLTLSTNLVTRFLGIKQSQEPAITEEEIQMLLDQGAESGVFDPVEEKIVDQVFRLGDRDVRSLMTPRLEIVWLDLDDPFEETIQKIISNGHSTMPVARESLDQLEGYVRANDMLAQCLQGAPLDIQSVLQEPLVVPESMQAFRVLERLKEMRSPMAFIVDEYGGIEGIMTLTDILEALVGELPEAEDLEQPDIVEREDGSFLIDGLVSIDEFRELFNLKELPGEEENYFDTLGGFVMTFLGQVPSPGDHFLWNKLRIEVMDMDGNRVDKVLVAMVEE